MQLPTLKLSCCSFGLPARKALALPVDNFASFLGRSAASTPPDGLGRAASCIKLFAVAATTRVAGRAQAPGPPAGRRGLRAPACELETC
eukprot:361775-Chlamydomonas_euryale.AAC.22